MKKNKIVGILLLLLVFNAQAIRVNFTAVNMSVNVAEGSTGTFSAFQIYPNSFEPDSLDSIPLTDFPLIAYSDLRTVAIEEGTLGSRTTFTKVASFPMTPDVTIGNKENFNIIQGNTYVYRLVLSTHSGQQIILLNRNITTRIPNPALYCVKLNNLYRKACHNCFQESIVNPYEGILANNSLYKGGFYHALNFTRVVELDIHKSDDKGDWDVRHTAINPLWGGSNRNNCVRPGENFLSLGDNPLSVCLSDVQLWRLDHPNHDPIILYLDLKSDFTSHLNHPNDLDAALISEFGAQNIYQPKDLTGVLPGDKRTAAQQNNWPSMGDLIGKVIVVLTGDGKHMDQYFYSLRNPNTQPIAFGSRTEPDPGDDFVFYNMNTRYIYLSQSVPQALSNLGYINRVWRSTLIGIPDGFSNNDYSASISAKMNSIAAANIKKDFNSSGNLENSWQETQEVISPVLVNNHIRSNYKNVTQAATSTIVANDLIVESGTHYRMVAGNKVTLTPGVLIKRGTDTKIRIDDCGGNYDYSSRKKESSNQLTDEEINQFLSQLDKDLYGYKPNDKEEITGLTIYPNPVTDVVNISYTNFLLEEMHFTLYDVTGRIVQTKTYLPENTGKQKFVVNVSDLLKGSYLYTLQQGSKTYKGKILK